MTLTFERLLVGENNKDPHVTENMNNMTRKELHKFKIIVGVLLVAETMLPLAAFVWLAVLTFSEHKIQLVKNEVNETTDIVGRKEFEQECKGLRHEVYDLTRNLTESCAAEWKSMEKLTHQVTVDVDKKLEDAEINRNNTNAKVDKLFSVAFHAVVSTRYPIINDRDKVKFDTSKLNTGNGYNPTTGVFTVPPGSGGLYFFSTHLVIDDKKWARLGMKKNDEFLCGFYEDNQSSANEDGTGSCSATVELNAGNQVYVFSNGATDNRPVECLDNWCGFTGFLMKPTN